MRAWILVVLTVLTVSACAALGGTAFAEDAGAGKPAAARVNTLSPDEARRAARARERAARLAKPAADAKPKPADQPAATAARDNGHAHATHAAEERRKPATAHASARHSSRRRHDYASGGGGGRAPRVGDYVGPNVRLRPLPPGLTMGSDDSEPADDEAPQRRAFSRRAYAPQPAPGAPPYPRFGYGFEQ